MSFYRGDTYFRTKGQKTIDAYTEGFLLTKDKNNRTVKEPLTTGTTKYNRMFLERINESINNYTTLMTIECTFIAIIQKCQITDYTFTYDISRIIQAQQGTKRYMLVLKDSLRKYPVKHQHLYNALKENLDRIDERYERNSKFLDTFATGCGFKQILDAIQNEYNLNIFDYIRQLNEKFDTTTNIFMYQTKKEYYDDLQTYCYDAINHIITSYNINIVEQITEAVKRKEEIKEKNRQETKKAKYDQQQALKIQHSNTLIELHTRLVYDALYEGNRNEKLSKVEYDSIIHKLLLSKGKFYYITIVKNKLLCFLSNYKGRETLAYTMTHAKWFPYDNEKKATEECLKLQEKYPDAIITKQCIEFKDIGSNLLEIKKPELRIEDFKNNIIKNISNGKYAKSTVLRFENFFKRNKTAWIIIAIKNCDSYYDCHIVSFNKNNAYPYYITYQNAFDPMLFTTQEQAENCVRELKNNSRLQKYELQVHKICYDDVLKYDTIATKALDFWLLGFTNDLSTNYLHITDNGTSTPWFYSTKCLYDLKQIVENHQHMYLIAKMDTETNLVQIIHCEGHNKNEPLSTIHNRCFDNIPIEKFRAITKVKRPVYATTSDKSEIKLLAQYAKKLEEKYLTSHIIKIIELSNTNGNYVWKIFETNDIIV